MLSLSPRIIATCSIVALMLASGTSMVTADDAPVRIRELFVPDTYLDEILAAAPQRVFLSRDEYDELLKKAHKKSIPLAPRAYTWLSSDHNAELVDGSMLVTGTWKLAIDQPGWHEVPVQVAGIHLQRLTLDGRPVSAVRTPDGFQLLVEGRGEHLLAVQFVATPITSAQQQSVTWRLPDTAVAKLRLTLPGDSRLVTEQVVLDRSYDAASDRTQYVMTPARTEERLAWTRSHSNQSDTLSLLSQNIVLHEITEQYERMYASYAVRIARGSTKQLRFSVDSGWEVVSIETPSLERWQIEENSAGRILTVSFTEEVHDRISLRIIAQRNGAVPSEWRASQILPLETVSCSTLIGVLLEDRLQLGDLQPTHLTGIDPEPLLQRIPNNWLTPEPGAPALKPIAAYYAPTRDYDLRGKWRSPSDKVRVLSNLAMHIRPNGSELQGRLALISLSQPIFECVFIVPTEWQVLEVTLGSETPVAFDHERLDNGRTRIHVHLPHSAAIGQPYAIAFRAHLTHDAWLTAWSEQKIVAPYIDVPAASVQQGALAVMVADEFDLRVDASNGLNVMDDKQREDFGVDTTTCRLAMRFARIPYNLAMTVLRRPSRITAESFSFLRLEDGLLAAHFEVEFQNAGAPTDRLTLQLPASTPAEIALQTTNGAPIQESSSEVRDGVRIWNLQLSHPFQGNLRLLVDFEQSVPTTLSTTRPLSEESTTTEPAKHTTPLTDTTLQLPIIQMNDVMYQTGYIAVEALPALLVTIDTDAAHVDVGAFSRASQQPGRHLLATHTFAGTVPTITVKVARSPLHGLPSAVVQHAVFQTHLSQFGNSHTVAEFIVKTGQSSLGIDLPTDSRLWSVMVDNKPTRPQRHSDHLLVALPMDIASPEHRLRVVYETPVARPSWLREISLNPTSLFLPVAESSSRIAVPVASIRWQVFPPPGYRLSGHNGTYEEISPQIAYRTQSAARRTLELTGGISATFDEAMAEEGRSASDASRDKEEAQEGQKSAEADQLNRPNEKSPIATKQFGGRSLPVELAASGNPLDFQGLGTSEQLVLQLVYTPRIVMITGAAIVAVLLAAYQLYRYPLKGLVLGCLVILIARLAAGAFFGLQREALWPVNAAIVTSLVSLSLIVISRFMARLFQHDVLRSVSSTVGVGLLVLATGSLTHAQADSSADKSHVTVTLDRDRPPLQVPDAAVLIPYDPAQVTDPLHLPPSKTVWIPYAEYQRLLELTRTTDSSHAPQGTGFAWSDAAWECTLSTTEQIVFEGKANLLVRGDGPQSVPFPLTGGVIEDVRVGDRPARLQLIASTPTSQEVAIARKAAAIPASLLALYMDSPGTHLVTIRVRFNLTRDGGWRIATGQLPVAAANHVVIKSTDPNSEVELKGFAVRKWTSTETPLATSWDADGNFTIRWRPQIARSTLVAGLTAESNGRINVVDNGLLVNWKTTIHFPGQQRSQIEFQVPTALKVRQIATANLREWTQSKDLIVLQFNAPINDSLDVELELFQDLTVTPASEFSVPDIYVVGTQRHTGTLAIHRSSHIELQVRDSRGVQRADRDGEVAISDSPLPLVPFQTFSFQGKFTLTLASALVPQSVRVELQSVLRLGETERSLETRLHVNVRGRDLHELRVNIPRDWRLEEVVGPEPLHWSQVPTADDSTISLFLSRGILGDVDIVLRGPLPERIANAPVQIPRLKVIDVTEQPHVLVVQADPGLDVQADQLTGCRTILLDQVGDWLQNDQREAARLAIEMTRPEYQGDLIVQERQPRIRWQTITNVQATDQNVQETILLDYHVDRAGVRELRFLLPEALRDATIRAPMLQRIIKEPASESDVPGWFRVRLLLQDRILGELRVLVELDRLMSPKGHSLPIPRPEGVDPGIQFVAVESSGWTEVSVRDVVGLEPLTRQHRDWKTLEASLGDQIVRAFRVTGDSRQSQITIERQVREKVTTTAARIAFAEAKLAIDPQGNYRGIQTYRMSNRTERHLEIQLPNGATLWAARVAGAPVKPLQGSDTIRIPIVKTAEGDQDYSVELVYGGRLRNLESYRRIQFPFVQPLHIVPETSQVRLYLPKQHQWLRFEGPMRNVRHENELAMELLEYQSQQIGSAIVDMKSSDRYVRGRAERTLADNLKQLTQNGSDTNQWSTQALPESAQLQDQLVKALELLETEPGQKSDEVDERLSNRKRLNEAYLEQRNGAISNSVTAAKSNFDETERRSSSEVAQVATPNNSASPDDSQVPHKQLRLQLKRSGPNQALQEFAKNDLGDARSNPVDHPNEQPSTAPSERGGGMGGGWWNWGGAPSTRPAAKEVVAPSSGPTPLSSADSKDPFGNLDASRPDNTVTGLGKSKAEKLPSGIASLDVQLDFSGQEFQFTTPRGDVRLSAICVTPESRQFGTLCLGLAVSVAVTAAFCVRRS